MPEESKLADKLENSSKFTEDEMKQVQEIQNTYMEVQNQFGFISVARIRLEDQLQNTMKSEEENIKKFKDIQEKERKFLDGITEKYGEGSLNPETGVFTPNK